MLSTIESIGRGVRQPFEKLWGEFILLMNTCYWIFVGPFIRRPFSIRVTLNQMFFAGVRSVLIISFVALFTGIVLAMQSAYQLVQFGVKALVAPLVAVSMCRELGPVFTALIVAGRVGSAITAEISSMKVNEQIEALDAMAINPVRFLVVPRFLGLTIMLPFLTIIADVMGMLGGFVIGFFTLKIDFA